MKKESKNRHELFVLFISDRLGRMLKRGYGRNIYFNAGVSGRRSIRRGNGGRRSGRNSCIWRYFILDDRRAHDAISA